MDAAHLLIFAAVVAWVATLIAGVVACRHVRCSVDISIRSSPEWLREDCRVSGGVNPGRRASRAPQQNRSAVPQTAASG